MIARWCDSSWHGGQHPEACHETMTVAQVSGVSGVAPHVGVVLPNSYSGNDSSHIAAAGIPSLLYPSGDRDGATAGRSVSQILACTRVYADMSRRICR